LECVAGTTSGRITKFRLRSKATGKRGSRQRKTPGHCPGLGYRSDIASDQLKLGRHQ